MNLFASRLIAAHGYNSLLFWLTKHTATLAVLSRATIYTLFWIKNGLFKTGWKMLYWFAAKIWYAILLVNGLVLFCSPFVTLFWIGTVFWSTVSNDSSFGITVADFCIISAVRKRYISNSDVYSDVVIIECENFNGIRGSIIIEAEKIDNRKIKSEIERQSNDYRFTSDISALRIHKDTCFRKCSVQCAYGTWYSIVYVYITEKC